MIHVGVANLSPEHIGDIHVSLVRSDLNNYFGSVCYRDFSCNPNTKLEKFFQENPDFESYFEKAFAYWIMCKIFIKENPNNYGLLKRKLKEYSGKLFRALRSLAETVARKIKNSQKKMIPNKEMKRKSYRNRKRRSR